MASAQVKLTSNGPLTYTIRGVTLKRDRYVTVTDSQTLELLKGVQNIAMKYMEEPPKKEAAPEALQVEKPKKQKATSL